MSANDAVPSKLPVNDPVKLPVRVALDSAIDAVAAESEIVSSSLKFNTAAFPNMDPLPATVTPEFAATNPVSADPSPENIPLKLPENDPENGVDVVVLCPGL